MPVKNNYPTEIAEEEPYFITKLKEAEAHHEKMRRARSRWNRLMLALIVVMSMHLGYIYGFMILGA